MRSNGRRYKQSGSAGALIAVCGSALVRVAVLFSTVGVAMALFLAPMLARDDGRQVADRVDLDPIATGSINHAGSYTIRRSVLSQKPGAVCVIRDDGRRTGDC